MKFKVKEIITGFYYLIFGNPEIKKMAAEREAICSKCEHASKQVYLHCSLCGCYIPAKARSKDSDCPDGRWPVINESNKK